MEVAITAVLAATMVVGSRHCSPAEWASNDLPNACVTTIDFILCAVAASGVLGGHSAEVVRRLGRCQEA